MLSRAMSTAHEPVLEALREMTGAMLEAAGNSRWTEVQRIDEARAKLLHELPAEVFRSTDENVRKRLGDALAATREIEKRLIEARDRIGRELKQSRERHRAVRTYQSVG